MAYTERSSQGWFSRIGNSFGGAILGFVMFLASFVLLFWNEGRAVKRAQDLEFGAENVVKAAAAAVDPKNEGKLVHVAGEATFQGAATDGELGVTAKALVLERKVEMYQWQEKSSSKKDKKLGGSEETVTTYTYNTDWSSNVINSSNFKEGGHNNPGSMPFSEQTFVATGIKVGAYALAPQIVEEINPDTDLKPAPTKMPANGKLSGNYVYIGANPQSPAVGDVRISYRTALAGPYSVVGGQQGGSIVEYVNKELNNPVVLLEKGTVAPEAMFKAAEDANAMMTLILRFVGFIVMFIGLRLMGRPLSVLADVLPFLGSAVGFVTGFVSFFIALGLSFITIAIAWIFYRPLIGLLLFLIAGGAIAAAVVAARKMSKAATA